jgi:hypothetical protein
MDKTSILVSTCDRDPPFLAETLESMFAADQTVVGRSVTLIVCGHDVRFLQDVALRNNVTVQPIDADRWKRVKRMSAKHRCAYNFRMLLEAAPPGGPIVALQDDLQFSGRWLQRTEEIAKKVAVERKCTRFIVALLANYKFKGRPYFHYDALRFYGNQALYMSSSAVRELRGYIANELDAGRYGPDDMMVKDWLQKTGCCLFAANPNLVQHIGTISAVGSAFFRSKTFEP